MKGEKYSDPGVLHDTGRYRCIATNRIGSVFLEQYIRIRVMGKFRPGSTFKDDAAQLSPTVGRMYEIACPPHEAGYGTSYRWGIVPKETRIPEYWRPGDPNPRIFQKLDGTLVYAVVTADDQIQSATIGGLRCILLNFGITVSSNQQMLFSVQESKFG